MGLPLAVLALVVAPPPRQSPAEPPNGCALRPRGDTEALPLCGDHPEPPEADGDPTAGYRPPSPIDLRRSIDEALGARPGIFRHGTVAGISVIGTVGIGTDGTAGSSATSTAGIGTTGLPGIGTTSTTATPSLGTTSTEGLTTTSITGLCTAGTPGMGTASMAGISATNASGFGTTTTLSPNTTSTAGCTTTGTPGLSTTSTLELSTTSTPSLGTDSTPALSTTTVLGPSAAGTAGLGTTATPDLSTTSTSGLGTAGTREPSTTSTPGLTPAGRPRPLQRAASLGGWSVMSPGARGRRGGGSPSAQGLSQGGLAAVPDPSPTRRGPPRAAPVLRPSQSWAGGSPCPPPAPRPQGGHPGGGVPAAGGVPERPGDSSSNRHSLGSDTIDL
ncbi:mucin-19-like [Falco cherrug]|uniref:mucin-19-like n=1 Tax=Falco cherrug TaxID=345164 RepID=UPI00247A7379|nr:mucin-19-like [Falco cherrug]